MTTENLHALFSIEFYFYLFGGRANETAVGKFFGRRIEKYSALSLFVIYFFRR